jgi:hypothetical protein
VNVNSLTSAALHKAACGVSQAAAFETLSGRPMY